jgi:hypothetical protein
MLVKGIGLTFQILYVALSVSFRDFGIWNQYPSIAQNFPFEFFFWRNNGHKCTKNYIGNFDWFTRVFIYLYVKSKSMLGICFICTGLHPNFTNWAIRIQIHLNTEKRPVVDKNFVSKQLSIEHFSLGLGSHFPQQPNWTWVFFPPRASRTF